MPERKSRIDGERTRGKILVAAEREFAEKGYELASVREISRRAGVNMALANRYFGSKEGLYRIVAKRLFGDLGEPMTCLPEKAVDEASWRDAIREWVDDFLFMTLPTEPAQAACAALFRHEVTRPTKLPAQSARARHQGRDAAEALDNLRVGAGFRICPRRHCLARLLPSGRRRRARLGRAGP